MKKITICIPTYKRSDLVIAQLDFLKKEIKQYEGFVNIIVAENYSSNAHREKLINYSEENAFFNFIIHKNNIGAIENIYFLLDMVDSDYVWFVSDDDVLLDGVIKRLFEIINNDKTIDYIYLKHKSFKYNLENIVSENNLLGYNGYFSNGNKCVVDLFLENGEISMFITSCVYRTAPLKEYCIFRQKQTLIDPLLFSLRLSVGPIYIENDVFVLQRWAVPSWSKVGVALFSWELQLGLIELLDFYEKKEVLRMINNTYESNRANYLRMLFTAPFYYKKAIVSFIGFKQFRLIYKSFFYNLIRMFEKIKYDFILKNRSK